MTIASFSAPRTRWMPGEAKADQVDDPSLTFSLPRRRAARVTSAAAYRFHCLSLCDQCRTLAHSNQSSSVRAHPCGLVGVVPLREFGETMLFTC